MWKVALWCLVGLSLPFVGRAQNTAYTALRSLGTMRGEQTLNQVVGMVGRSGKSQPGEWRITIEDAGARGGVREFTIAAGKIVAERTPARPDSTRKIPLDSLNLDSDGAFNLAENEAKKNGVGFDSANYRLASDSASGKPIWLIDLLDETQQLVGSARVSADSGNLVSSGNWVVGKATGRVAQNQNAQDQPLAAEPTPTPRVSIDNNVRRYAPNATDNTYSNQNGATYQNPGNSTALVPGSQYNGYVDQNSTEDETISERAHRYGANAVHFGKTVANKTEHAFRKAGGWIQKKLTGKDTISEPSIPSSDDVVPDRYNTPVTPQRDD